MTHGKHFFQAGLGEYGRRRPAPRRQAVMTFAFVLKIKNPVPSNSFIKVPVRDRLAFGKEDQPPAAFQRKSAMLASPNTANWYQSGTYSG